MTQLFKTPALLLALSLSIPAGLYAMSHGNHDHEGEKAEQAADAHHDHSTMMQQADENATASTKAFMVVNDTMHKDMMIEFTGDADIDFVRGMVPHHQGAIDMAKVVLEHGKDEAIRKLAEEIISAQETEIAMMEAWLAENAPPASKTEEKKEGEPDGHAHH